MEENSSRGIILWFFLSLFLVSAFFLGWLLRPFLSIIILAIVVAGAFNPAYNLLEGKLSPRLASFVTCTLIFIVLFVPLVLFAGVLSKEAYDLYLMGKVAVSGDQFKDFIVQTRVLERANAYLSSFQIRLTGQELYDTVSEVGKIVGLFLFRQANSIASNVFAFLINFFFMLIIIYFLLIDGNRLIAFITNLSPLPSDQDEKLFRKFRDMARAVILINGLGGIIQGTFGGIVFALFGLNSPFLWGVVMGLLALLPILGIGAVFIPAAVYFFIEGSIGAGVFFIVFYLLLSSAVEYFLKPRLVGQRAKMHSLLVFLSIIGGLKLFGILGIVYGPLVVTAFLTLSDIYQQSYQKQVEKI